MKRFIVLAVVALFAPAVALAGGFAGISGGSAKVDGFCTGVSGPGVTCDDTGSSWRVFGGAMFTPNLGVELGYADLGKVGGSIGWASASVKANALDATVIGAIPLGRASVYGKVGLYSARSKLSTNFGLAESVSNTDLTYGAGLRFDFSDRVGARLEWQRYQDVGGGDLGASDVDTLSAGVVLAF